MPNNNRRNTRGDAEASGAPRWVVFMGGVTTGVLATVVAGALLWPRTGTLDSLVPSPSIADAKNEDAIEYQYEPMLRDSQVPVPPPGATESAAVATSEAPARVVLQAGSFRAAGDAEELRAQLLLLDIGPVTTREALVKDGEVWHRVFIGPFATEQAMRTARDKLTQQNINAFSIAAPADMPLPAPSAAPARSAAAAASTAPAPTTLPRTASREPVAAKTSDLAPKPSAPAAAPASGASKPQSPPSAATTNAAADADTRSG